MEKTARDIAQRLRAAAHIAYFAGGCVRDMVRGLAAKDFDVATDATPEVVQKIFSHTYAVGAHFGVVVVVENGFNFEVATFRSDGAYLDHRHPVDVRFSSPEEDAKRRDFTINGMFFDPEKNEVIDFVGGRADLEAKLVRAIGDPAARFAEDRLRMLRAVRFATVLDYKIDNRTWDALVANAASINEISAERIREELVRIFLSANRVRGWDLLDESGLLRTILPELRLFAAGAISSRGRCFSAHATDAGIVAGRSFGASRVRRFTSRRRETGHRDCRRNGPNPFQRARPPWRGNDGIDHGTVAIFARGDRRRGRDGATTHGF